MAILCPNRGDQICITNGLRLSVLGFSDHGATFSVCDADFLHDGAARAEQIAAACRSASCYFWFPIGGCRTLVVKCGQGKTLSLAEFARLTVLNVSFNRLTLAITIGPHKSSDSRVRIRARRSSPVMKSDGSLGQSFAAPAA
jgi:hypothetical protein